MELVAEMRIVSGSFLIQEWIFRNVILQITSVSLVLPFTDSLFSSLLQLVPKLTRNFMKEGFMEKTGPKVGAFWPLKIE